VIREEIEDCQSASFVSRAWRAAGKQGKVMVLRTRARVPDPMPRAHDPNVFDYLDYRAFLRDLFAERKRRRGLSYRGFARRTGLRSPNYLQIVVEGKRNLSADLAMRIAEAFGLDPDEREFFCELVRFNQARSASERNAAYSHLTGHRRYRQVHPLDLKHAAYHSTWYIPAIRELAARADFQEDPSWIARALIPNITRAEASRALSVLIDLDLLVRDERGHLVQSQELVSTGAEVHRHHIANYHRMMMDMAARSIDTVPSADRDISSLTLCLGEGGLRTLKERIQRFRRELLDLSTLETDPRQVVQVNFQLFPLSTADDPEEAE
jgi:uncharacterized protein (TIGR02147 family)